MSGISLLLETAERYERTHQLVLFALLKESSLSEHLLGAPRRKLHTDDDKAIELEPSGGKFDLKIIFDSDITAYLELKMWADFGYKQLQRQCAFLKDENARGFHILLGKAWFKHTPEEIDKESEGRAKKIGVADVIRALDNVLMQKDEKHDVHELALAYRNKLQNHLNWLNGKTDTGEMSDTGYEEWLAKLKVEYAKKQPSDYTPDEDIASSEHA
ncbi:MAG: hypothetical protein CL946_11460 [Ectothiorhodospiraceae bacterium]|nr:hypothetical protein [Ectothiorhodospiraceae bacterium]